MPDKYTATWVSHTSLRDFLDCPRAYYLKHVYKNPKTGKKMKIMSPPLALGQAVHEVIESLSTLPVDKRFSEPLMSKFTASWTKIAGKRGGFTSKDTEELYKSRGKAMIERVTKHPGPLKEKAVKIKGDLPYYWLSEEDEIILCGKIDWLQYLPDKNSVNIIDFKTGSGKEDDKSLQLPIYLLLVTNCQHFAVSGAAYWYLELSDELTPKQLPDKNEAYDLVLEKAREVKLARKLNRFKCPHDGCRSCTPYERILSGEGEFVYVDSYKTEVYVLNSQDSPEKSAVIL